MDRIAWDTGRMHVTRLRAEADADRLVRTATAQRDEGGRHAAADIARRLAARLVAVADVLERRRAASA
jgi:hypothetical protein